MITMKVLFIIPKREMLKTISTSLFCKFGSGSEKDYFGLFLNSPYACFRQHANFNTTPRFGIVNFDSSDVLVQFS